MDGKMIGYARVSSTGQDFDTQVEKLKAAGVTKVFNEKLSGLDRERPELAKCLDYAREGDTLVVTKLDRLARSASHLHQIVEGLTAKGVGFRVLDDASLDTTTRTGKLVFGILASIAEFETALRRERQMEGIAKAKAEGKSGGRPAMVTPEIKAQIVKLSSEGRSIRKVAAEVGFSKATVQKVLATAERPARV
ncbi:recombinase family protein [Mesorhizobium sp. INR15]|uniref:recombinase family protein n=1 Tax=Mesorhizobium sp. INR15 TaxID=2654248 RepID=UPI001896421F|nr:recombinase family protein [Mesorhizobium sp. INR15]QPC90010.1 helix-turn-helix domain-containing protein [Mesorhizobium sp. INR15]